MIRALEPMDGIPLMERSRKTKEKRNLTNGPGKLCAALKIDKKFNRADLTRGNLLIVEGAQEKFRIICTTRIGISDAKERRYRFYIKNNAFVSRK